MNQPIHAVIKLMIVFLLLSSISVFSSPKSEQKKYAKLQKKWVYKAYRKISKESVRGITQAYNYQTKEQPENTIDRAYIHALLSFMWSTGLDANFAIAESHLSLQKAVKPKDKYIAQTALSLALYNKGWSELAREQSNQINNNSEFKGFAKKYKKEQLFANLIVGSLAIREGNIKVTQDTFEKIAIETNKPWITTLAKTAALAMTGSIFDATSQFKVLVQDPSLTIYEREKIEEIQLLAKSEMDEKRKQTKVSQLVDGLLFDSIKEQSKTTYKGLVGDLSDYIDDIDL